MPTVPALLGNWRQVPFFAASFNGGQFAGENFYEQGGSAGRPTAGNQLQVFEVTDPVVSNGGRVWTSIDAQNGKLSAGVSLVVAGSFHSARTDVMIGTGSIQAGVMGGVRYSWPGGLFGAYPSAYRSSGNWVVRDSSGSRLLLLGDNGSVVRSADASVAGLAQVVGGGGDGTSDVVFTGFDGNGRIAYHAIRSSGVDAANLRIDLGWPAVVAQRSAYVYSDTSGDYVLKAVSVDGLTVRHATIVLNAGHGVLRCVRESGESVSSGFVNFTPVTSSNPLVQQSTVMMDSTSGWGPYRVNLTLPQAPQSTFMSLYRRGNSWVGAWKLSANAVCVAVFESSWSLRWARTFTTDCDQMGLLSSASGPMVLSSQTDASGASRFLEVDFQSGAVVRAYSVAHGLPLSSAAIRATRFNGGAGHIISLGGQSSTVLVPVPAGAGTPQAWRLQNDGSGIVYAVGGESGDIWCLNGIDGGSLFVTGANLANATFALACKPMVAVQASIVPSAPAFLGVSVTPVAVSSVVVTPAPPLPPLQFNAQATSFTITEHFVQPQPVCSGAGN